MRRRLWLASAQIYPIGQWCQPLRATGLLAYKNCRLSERFLFGLLCFHGVIFLEVAHRQAHSDDSISTATGPKYMLVLVQVFSAMGENCKAIPLEIFRSSRS